MRRPNTKSGPAAAPSISEKSPGHLVLLAKLARNAKRPSRLVGIFESFLEDDGSYLELRRFLRVVARMARRRDRDQG